MFPGLASEGRLTRGILASASTCHGGVLGISQVQINPQDQKDPDIMASYTKAMTLIGILLVLGMSLDLTYAQGTAVTRGGKCKNDAVCEAPFTCQAWKHGLMRCLPENCLNEGDRCGWWKGKCCTDKDVYCYKAPGSKGYCRGLTDIPADMQNNVKRQARNACVLASVGEKGVSNIDGSRIKSGDGPVIRRGRTVKAVSPGTRSRGRSMRRGSWISGAPLDGVCAGKAFGTNGGQDKPLVPDGGQDKPLVPDGGQDKPLVPNGGLDEPIGGQDKPLVPNRGQDKPLVPNGGQDKPLVPNGGQDKPLVPNGGQDKPLVPNGGQDKPLVPNGGQDKPLVPNGGQDKPLVPNGWLDEPMDWEGRLASPEGCQTLEPWKLGGVPLSHCQSEG
eukprot:maker-scaffold368_size193847-snap-gene-0.29 protein:Tk10002 transcript:maker-scaffold368_size193847-snap-gene-0.29-mRNA-1 annotation:"autotransporter"